MVLEQVPLPRLNLQNLFSKSKQKQLCHKMLCQPHLTWFKCFATRRSQKTCKIQHLEPVQWTVFIFGCNGAVSLKAVQKSSRATWNILKNNLNASGCELIWGETNLVLYIYNILSYMLTSELKYGTLGRDFGRPEKRSSWVICEARQLTRGLS